jgi:hypothetical protein
MLRKMNDEGQPAQEQPHRRSCIKYARLPLYGYNIGAGVTWEGGRRGMAAAAMVGGMSLVSNCVACDIFFLGGACTNPKWSTVHSSPMLPHRLSRQS